MCETLCLVCPACSEAEHEHYCEHHAHLRGAYCWFLDVHDVEALDKQAAGLEEALAAPPALKSVNRRRRQGRRDEANWCSARGRMGSLRRHG